MTAAEFFTTEGEVVVYDTEFTTWDGAKERDWSGEGEHRELVQIAAQKIDLASESVLASFERLVRPKINPTLSQYFIDLTHITQEQVDADGVSFAEMFEEFLAWSRPASMYAYSMRPGDYADMDVLEENIQLYDLPVVLPKERFGNLYPVFASAGVDTTQYNSGKLYQAFGLDLGGHEHNAMHDVDSLVQSLFALKRSQ